MLHPPPLWSWNVWYRNSGGSAPTKEGVYDNFRVMQFTGRVDWDTLFRKNETASTPFDSRT